MLLFGGTFLTASSTFALALNRLIQGHHIDSLDDSTNIIEGYATTTNPICLNDKEYIICVDKTYYRTINNDKPIFVCKTIQYNDNVIIENLNKKSNVWQYIQTIPLEPIDITVDEIQPRSQPNSQPLYEQDEIPITHIEHRFYGIKNNTYFTIFQSNESSPNIMNPIIMNPIITTPIITNQTKDQYIADLKNRYLLTKRSLTSTLILGLGFIGLSIFLNKK